MQKMGSSQGKIEVGQEKMIQTTEPLSFTNSWG